MINVFSVDGSIVHHRSQIDDAEHDYELFSSFFLWLWNLISD